MKSFYYKAIDPDGDVSEGKRVAQDRSSLTNFLEERGMTPVKIEPQSSFWLHPIYHKERLARFFRNLNLFLKSGMELLQALELVKGRLDNEESEACLETIIEDIRQGRSFGDALKMCEPFFPPSVHRICAVAEETGNLTEATDELADYFDSQYEFFNDLYSMLLYPFIVLIVSLGITVFLFTVVVPRLRTVIPDDQTLPALSRIVFSISGFMQGWGFWAVVSGLLLAPVGLYYLYRTEPVQRLVSYLLNKSQLYKSIKTQLFCLAMGMSTRVGMEITRALKLSKQVLGDARLENKIERVIEQVRQGHSLTDSLGEQGFNSLPLDSLRAGEESGNLEEVFTFQADLLGEDISRQLDRLVTVIEPVVIFAMACLVGLIMASVLLPIFSLTSSL
jgi:type IV pilus assembly protein PilC